MSDLVVIVPSRGRPRGMQELIDTWNAEAQLIVRVDEDDPELSAYLDLPADVVVGPRLRLGPSLNEQALQWTGCSRVVGFMGDDHRPRTPGWDQKILDALDRSGVAYGDDLYHGKNLPTAVFISSEIVAALGYFCPPGMVHLYLDNFWKILGEHLQRLVFVSEVTIEHMHPVFGKGEWDDRYREVNAPEVWDADKATFDRYVAEDFASALDRVRRVLT